MIPQGGTIGILGGGQLGRMLAVAAAQLGYRCHIYAPEQDSIAADVGAAFTCADWHDTEALTRFVQDCDVITLEFENIPVAPLKAIPAGKLAPGTNALEVAQDRLREKRFVETLGGVPAPFAAVDSREDLDAAIERIGQATLGVERHGVESHVAAAQIVPQGRSIESGQIHSFGVAVADAKIASLSV